MTLFNLVRTIMAKAVHPKITLDDDAEKDEIILPAHPHPHGQPAPGLYDPDMVMRRRLRDEAAVPQGILEKLNAQTVKSMYDAFVKHSTLNPLIGKPILNVGGVMASGPSAGQAEERSVPLEDRLVRAFRELKTADVHENVQRQEIVVSPRYLRAMGYALQVLLDAEMERRKRPLEKLEGVVRGVIEEQMRLMKEGK